MLLFILSNQEFEIGKHITFSCDFNLYFNISLDAKGSSTVLKITVLGICDIWRIRISETKQYPFRQQHLFDLFNDYLFVSQNLQEVVKNTEIPNAFLSHHSPVFCSILNNYQKIKKRKDYNSKS